MKKPDFSLARLTTRLARRYLVGAEQPWVLQPPAQSWRPPHLDQTSLYLHVPFCRSNCPYCPYTKVPLDNSLLAPFTRAAVAEVDWWADRTGPAELTSLYIGGGTPTLALDSVDHILGAIRSRFRLAGDICIETNPADINAAAVHRLGQIGVTLVSLGVQSFHPHLLSFLGRRYDATTAREGLERLTGAGFASVNVDIMFALPGQTDDDLCSDLALAAELGATQITAYPVFTFPYTAVGEHLRLKSVRMPNLRLRRRHYQALCEWCAMHGFERVSVWGFKRGTAPRYSSVTRDGYIGIGPSAGSYLPGEFVLNTFDLASWMEALDSGSSAVALRLPFTAHLSAWWWLYWRFYETRIPLAELEPLLEEEAAQARPLLKGMVKGGLARQQAGYLELTDRGAFWLHLLQNYFALDYVNSIWSRARFAPWPQAVAI